MNKYIIILLFTVFSTPAAAQLGEQRNNFAIGINGGANLSNVSFTPTIKQDYNLGYNGGITARYISEKYFAMICGVQVELNYSQRGWKEKIESVANTYSRTMGYLEIPFMAHLAFGKDHKAQFFLNMGPQIAFLVNEKENFGGTDKWDPSKRPNGINSQYNKLAENKFDYGLIAGAGVDIPTKIGHFLLESRYYLGLGDFYKSEKSEPFEKTAHNIISIKMSYLFDLSK